MRRSLFSLSEEESKYFADDQPKIEVVNCPQGKEICMEQLAVINQYFLESRQSHLKKDYQKSIHALKLAFNATFEIKESTCLPHTDLFRLTIICSLETIHSDLNGMTTGWFKAKRFQSSFELATLVLDDCRMKQSGVNDSCVRG